jgi:hypothetical protein
MTPLNLKLVPFYSVPRIHLDETVKTIILPYLATFVFLGWSRPEISSPSRFAE